MPPKYLEDLKPGTSFGGLRYAVARDEMLEFARKWDPRPIHVDDEAGRAAGFGGAIASGAYTTAIFTRLALASRDDPIVPLAMSQAIWNEIVWSEDGSHVLPLRHPRWCARHVLEFGDALAS